MEHLASGVSINSKDETIIKERINEELLCVLRENKLTNQIEVDYVKIENPFSAITDNLDNLCDNPNSTLQQILNFIKATAKLNHLTDHYRYCVYLHGTYQAFSANNQDTITEITEIINESQLRLLNKENNYEIEKAIAEYTAKLKKKYVLWSKAYSINKTYRFCQQDKSILTFSHRITGWSNPVYQLTPDFSVEIKTNFGFGKSSYFYTKLKYKNIDIIPFSYWVNYQFAKFSDLARYTQLHVLQNESWLEAMEFSRDACNLSMTDETKFVEKYIIDECESMVSGLEKILNKEGWTFKNRGGDQHSTAKDYHIGKERHVLGEFRGEKISGALDFISKILEFEKITPVKSFIDRIEVCNKKIQPILVNESKILKEKITNLTRELNAFKPTYDNVIKLNDVYKERRFELQNQMTSYGQFNVLSFHILTHLDYEFNKKYPGFKEFEVKFKEVTKDFRILTERIQNLTKVCNNIISYNDRIIQHFGRQENHRQEHIYNMRGRIERQVMA